MKVVLFCGGMGMRMREYSEAIPKPMVPIGYRPILWHVMKYYAHYGHKDFILCLGYKADVIKNYFRSYDECVSNDFVLSGGELAAALILDAVTRLIPGALGNEDSAVNESFSAPLDADLAARGGAPSPATPRGARGILDCPHYTRPQSFRGWDVPDVLVGGHHEEIRRWRQERAIEKTLRNRPDLISGGA